jgi:class 3 adenylate cyclase/tetratricopeptide (TPR) repeat protein
VLFADLVGFTPLSEARDPEEVRELLSEYFATARTVIARYGGTVEKFIGDAVMAVWGVPIAHEDDADRAVRAGLDLVAAVSDLGDRVGASGLAARVGIVTGEVAVTLGAVGEGMVAGDAVNTAARVQSVAAPGQVWVDDATHALSAAVISYVDVGERELKGKSGKVRLYAARAVVASVGGAQRVDGLEAPLAGRDRELRLVKELFHASAEERRPHLVAIYGAAGIGKSRLGWEFEKYVDGITELTANWHRGRALSYGDGVAFWALTEMARARLGLIDGDPPSIARQRLDTTLQTLTTDPGERQWLAPRLGTLLNLDGAGDSFSREDLFAAWTTFFERIAKDDSVVLVFEDMQYADNGLLEFIDYLHEGSRFPIFIVVLARPELAEARPAFGTGRRATSIYLEPLPEPAMRRLVEGLVHGLPDGARDALVERAEGMPLYAVETVRALIDRDAVVPRGGQYVLADDDAGVDLETLVAPASLQALIAARLDALTPAERQVVQDASVHGLAFARDSLAVTSNVEDLDHVLAALVRKEILVLLTDRFSSERGQYRFMQALVRNVAYDTLSRRDRKARHLAVAAQLSAESGDELAAVVARHYLDALDAGPSDPDAPQLEAAALGLLEQAASRAESLGSPEEALRHCRSALDRAQESAARARLHIAAARAQLSLAQPADALTDAETAREIYIEASSSSQAAEAIGVSADALLALGRTQDAIDLAAPWYDRLTEDPAAMSAVALLAERLARAHSIVGNPEAADRYNRQALMLAEASGDWGQVVTCITRTGVEYVTRGAPTAGLVLLRGAADLARQHNMHRELIRALSNIAAFSNSRDNALAEAAGREATELSLRLGARDSAAMAAANLAVARWLAGRWDEVEELYAEHGPHVTRSVFSLGLLSAATFARLNRGRSLDLSDVPTWGMEDPLARYSFQFVDACAAASEQRWGDACRAASVGFASVQDYCGLDDDFGTFWPIAVEFALGAGDLAEARRLLDVVEQAPPGLISPLVRAHQFRLRALVTRGEGAPVDAVDADLVAAAEAFREFGAPYYLARTLLDHVQLLGASGDSERAAPLLGEARELFQTLDAVPWMQTCNAVSVVSVD